MSTETEADLERAIAAIVEDPSRKKLVVAGPGTGKTWLFERLLQHTRGDTEKRLVLTFINNLKDDLEGKLSELATVRTLHGFCQRVMRDDKALRGRLSPGFRCQPLLAALIQSDWTFLRSGVAPEFVKKMRNRDEGEEIAFYLERGDYYDAVDFDDSVYRVYLALRSQAGTLPNYELVLVDEYQDFNAVEAAIIDALAQNSPIVVAGDDDQALYSQFRGASWDFIRSLHAGTDYKVFSLPYCLRCPEVIVTAVNDIVASAMELEKLDGRIDKPYQPYAPVKGEDSKRYPHIELVSCSVQSLKSNYFGKYVEEALARIPQEESEDAKKRSDPLVLLIGSRQYLNEVVQHLEKRGYAVDRKKDENKKLAPEDGLQILHEDSKSNLGWRMMLHFEKPEFASTVVKEAAARGAQVVDVVPADFRAAVEEQVKLWTKEPDSAEPAPEARSAAEANDGLVVKATSFQGAKGLSAYHSVSYRDA